MKFFHVSGKRDAGPIQFRCASINALCSLASRRAVESLELI